MLVIVCFNQDVCITFFCPCSQFQDVIHNSSQVSVYCMSNITSSSRFLQWVMKSTGSTCPCLICSLFSVSMWPGTKQPQNCGRARCGCRKLALGSQYTSEWQAPLWRVPDQRYVGSDCCSLHLEVRNHHWSSFLLDILQELFMCCFLVESQMRQLISISTLDA